MCSRCFAQIFYRPLFRPHGQAPPSKLRIRIRLPAAIVNWNACSTLCRPRNTVCLRPPITLPQPKRSSTSLRLFRLTALPGVSSATLIDRAAPVLGDVLHHVRRDTLLAAGSDEVGGVVSLVRTDRFALPSRQCAQHGLRRSALTVSVSVTEARVYDKAAAILGQQVPLVAPDRARVIRFADQPRVRISRRCVGCTASMASARMAEVRLVKMGGVGSTGQRNIL